MSRDMFHYTRLCENHRRPVLWGAEFAKVNGRNRETGEGINKHLHGGEAKEAKEEEEEEGERDRREEEELGWEWGMPAYFISG